MKKHINIELFNEYKNNEAQNILKALGINVANKNLLNQITARGLGFDSYEALQPQLKREKDINELFTIERCPAQANRITVKAQNIVLVIDDSSNTIFAKALSNFEECIYIDEDNADGLMIIQTPGDEPFDDITKLKNNSSSQRAQSFTIMPKHELQITKTDEGIIVDLYYRDECIDSMGICHDDAEDDFDKVDLVTPFEARTIPDSEMNGEYYQWQQQVHTSNTFGGKRFKGFVDMPTTGDFSLSSIIFSSVKEAENAVATRMFGTFDIGGCSIVKVTKQFAANTNLND